MAPDPAESRTEVRNLVLPYYYIMQSRGHETQAEKPGAMSLITLPKESNGSPLGYTAKPIPCTLS